MRNLGGEPKTGVPHCDFYFYITTAQKEPAVLRALFGAFATGLIDPKAIAVLTPGRESALPGSMVASAVDWHDPDALAPGEYEVPGTNFTKLEIPDRYLSIQGRADELIGQILQVLKEHRRDRGGTWSSVWVSGLTTAYYVSPTGELARDSFLRERLTWADNDCICYTYHELLRLGLSLDWPPAGKIEVRLLSYSRVWTEYQERPWGDGGERWPKKADLRAAEANCRMLAEHTAAFLSSLPATTVKWETGYSEGAPVHELLARKIEERIGLPRTSLKL